MKFTVDRKTWLRGDPKDSRLLRKSDQKMCCLGFLGEACGIPRESMTNEGEPTEVQGYESNWPIGLLEERDGEDRPWYQGTNLCGDIIEANDTLVLEQSERERRLAALFAKINVEVEFVG